MSQVIVVHLCPTPLPAEPDEALSGAVSHLLGLGLNGDFSFEPSTNTRWPAADGSEPNYRNKLKTEAEVALDTTANGVGDLPAAMWMYCRLRLACGRRPPASASVSYGGAAACVRNRIQSHDLQSENLPQPRHLDTSKSPRGHHIMDLRTWLPPSSCWPVPSPETHEVDPTTPHTQDLHTADRWSGLSLVQVRVLTY